MKRLTWLFLLLVPLIAFSDSADPDYTKMKPVEFLKMLHEKCCEPKSVGWVPLPKDWITAADMKELKKFLKDNRPASPVYSPYSSRHCTEKSTVRREALYLIKGYLEKRYPPGLCSTDFELKSVRVPTN